MPKNNTKSVLKALLKRKNAPKWAKWKKRRLSDKRRPLSEAESFANLMIENEEKLSSSIFNRLPERWFREKGIIKPKDFNNSNHMLQNINTLQSIHAYTAK